MIAFRRARSRFFLSIFGVFLMTNAAVAESNSDDMHEAWKNFNDSVARAYETIKETPRYKNSPEHRAQALYSIAEAQTMAYNFVIAPRQNNPRIYGTTSWNSYLYTLGQNGPDALYGIMLLNGKQTYRLSGRLGDLKLILFQLHNQILGYPGSKPLGNYDLNDFEVNADGSFEIIMSAEEHPGNWIALDGESEFNFVIVRRWFGEWSDDVGSMDIEMLEPLNGYSEFDEGALAMRLNMAAHFVTFLVEEWSIGLHDLYIKNAGGTNKLWYMGGEELVDLLGSPSTSYGLGVFDCAEDEALIIESGLPESAYWSYQLGDVWSKSLDFTHKQTDVNMARAVIDVDGKFRAVVAHQDPGVPNWLDPVSRKEFTIVFRNYRETGDSRIAPPTVKRVKFSEIRDQLPSQTAEISTEERERQLDRRRKGYVKILDTY
ncbi:MAG: DUF1214 domain-containing protein [Halieaceae bacterium]|nr:DUF1214 domain-containing protein [Halieaceae bacterium]